MTPGSGEWLRRLLAVGLGVVVSVCCVYAFLWCLEFLGVIHTIPPRTQTLGTMEVLKRRIVHYARAHGVAPVTIKDLPPVDGYSDRTADEWGNPIEMIVNRDQIVLRSLGRDERTGGVGDDQDMVGVFSLRTAEGQWTDESVTWIQDPFGR